MEFAGKASYRLITSYKIITEGEEQRVFSWSGKKTQFSKPFVLGCGRDIVLYNGTGKFNTTVLYVISRWVEGREHAVVSVWFKNKGNIFSLTA